MHSPLKGHDTTVQYLQRLGETLHLGDVLSLSYILCDTAADSGLFVAY